MTDRSAADTDPVGPNTVTTTITGREGSVELRRVVTVSSEVGCAVPTGPSDG
jgi:hypothetical protein